MDALVDRQSEQQHSQLTKQQPCRASETVAGSSTATLRVVACLLQPSAWVRSALCVAILLPLFFARGWQTAQVLSAAPLE
jgi:hypothetical protein